jgi:hypothetical protein
MAYVLLYRLLILLAILSVVFVAYDVEKTREPRDDLDIGPSRFDKYCSKEFIQSLKKVQKRKARQERSGVRSAFNRSFIYGGSHVLTGVYPYLVGLFISNGKTSPTVCSGTLLDEWHVLTAAHCVASDDSTNSGTNFVDVSNPTVLTLHNSDNTAKEHNPNKRRLAEAIYFHHNYDQVNERSGTDIAVIRLKIPISLSQEMYPVCLASAGDKLPDRCVAFGYGHTANTLNAPTIGILNKAPIYVNSSDECNSDGINNIVADTLNALQTSFRNGLQLSLVFQGKICSLVKEENKFQSICKGDSGGPLMCTPKGEQTDSRHLDPLSPLFNQTDPTLRQFGINQGGVPARESNCVLDGPSVTFFASMRGLRVWLEYVAWPLLQDPARFQGLERERYEDCMPNMDWKGVEQAAGLSEVTHEHKHVICKAVVAYTFCLQHTPKVHYCNHLQLTVPHLTHVDLLRLIRNEAFCRMLGTARPRHANYTKP